MTEFDEQRTCYNRPIVPRHNGADLFAHLATADVQVGQTVERDLP